MGSSSKKARSMENWTKLRYGKQLKRILSKSSRGSAFPTQYPVLEKVGAGERRETRKLKGSLWAFVSSWLSWAPCSISDGWQTRCQRGQGTESLRYLKPQRSGSRQESHERASPWESVRSVDRPGQWAAWEHVSGTSRPTAPGGQLLLYDEAVPWPSFLGAGWGWHGGQASHWLQRTVFSALVPAWILQGPPRTSGNLMFSKLYFYAQQALGLPG